MIRTKDIKWFLEEPTRLMQMKPFTRGGTYNLHAYEKSRQGILNNTMLETGFADLTLHPISQDLYITEYRPDLHHVILNKAIPHIKVVLDGRELPTNMMEITQTASFQKLIHSAHVRNLTANPIEFNLCNETYLVKLSKSGCGVTLNGTNTWQSTLASNLVIVAFCLAMTRKPRNIR